MRITFRAVPKLLSSGQDVFFPKHLQRVTRRCESNRSTSTIKFADWVYSIGFTDAEHNLRSARIIHIKKEGTTTIEGEYVFVQIETKTREAVFELSSESKLMKT